MFFVIILCDVSNNSVLSSGILKAYEAISSPIVCLSLQSDIHCVRDLFFFSANFMTVNFGKI